jgi:hypothetical protein
MWGKHYWPFDLPTSHSRLGAVDADIAMARKYSATNSQKESQEPRQFLLGMKNISKMHAWHDYTIASVKTTRMHTSICCVQK